MTTMKPWSRPGASAVARTRPTRTRRSLRSWFSSPRSAVPHFREEEELLFPRVADAEEARELVVQALLEHQRLHAAAAELGELVVQGPSDHHDSLG